MAKPENRIFCRLDGLTPAAREQKRLATLRELDLLTAETVAVFDEATQTVARFLDAPICILGFMTLDQLQIKSAVGLSRVGLMNPLAQLRQLPRQECFCTYVVETHQVLAIQDTKTNPVFSSSLLVQHYGISAYLGAPLLAADGQCLGTLAVMDWEPRDFTARDKEFLAITARWCMSEYERNHVLKEHPTSSVQRLSKPSITEPDNQEPNFIAGSWRVNSFSDHLCSLISLKVKLLTQLTQELRTPLTSVMGMASVLNRQVYGPLTSKQKEYLEIIHHSGQHLVSLVDEIVALSVLDETSEQLHLTSVDIDMLCQQAIHSLFKIANQRQQQIRLSVEPGSRIWLLDKDKVRQMLYHLVFSVIHSAQTGSEIRIHVSRRNDKLNIAVWVFHPWLGDTLPAIYEGITGLPSPSTTATATGSDILETSLTIDKLKSPELTESDYQLPVNPLYSSPAAWAILALTQEQNQKHWNHDSREALGLLLSCKLAELHQGEISVEGSLESGYRYVVSLPQLELAQERL